MDPRVENLLAWITAVRSRNGVSGSLSYDVGCAEIASADAEVESNDSTGGNEGVPLSSASSAERYGVLEPISTVLLAGYRSSGSTANGTAEEEKKGDAEGENVGATNENEKTGSSTSTSGGGGGGVEASVLLSLCEAGVGTESIKALLCTPATHIGIGFAVNASSNRVALVINYIQRRAHITSVDGHVGSGSSPLQFRATTLLRGTRVTRLSVLPEAGPNVRVLGATVYAAPPSDIAGMMPMSSETLNISSTSTTSPSSSLLTRVTARVRSLALATEGERSVYQVPPHAIGHDDEGGSLVDIPIGEVYAAVEHCSGRYVVDVYVEGEISSSTTTASTSVTEPTATASGESKEGEGSGAAQDEATGAAATESQETKEGEGVTPAAAAAASTTDTTTTSIVKGPVFATRFVITVIDHDDAGAAAQLESASLPSTISIGPVSEVAVGLGNPSDLPESFHIESLPMMIHPSAMVRRLPLIACGAATEGVPPVSHLLMVTGATEAEAIEQLPPGYEHVPFNIAAELAMTMGAIPLAQDAHRGVAAAAAASSTTEEGGAEQPADAEAVGAGAGEGGSSSSSSGSSSNEEQVAAAATQGDTLSLDVDPPYVFLAVLRDGAGAPCQHIALAAVASVPGSDYLPAIAAPVGYSIQMVDLGLRTPGLFTTAADAEQGGPVPIRRVVRVVLAQTTDADAAGAAGLGPGIVVGSESDNSNDMYGSNGGMSEADQALLAAQQEEEEYAAEAAAAAAESYAADRARLIELVQAAMEENETLGREGTILQRQLGAYFFNRLSEEERERVSASLLANGGKIVSTIPATGAGAAYAEAERQRKYHEQLIVVSRERNRTEEAQQKFADKAIALQEVVDEKEARLGTVQRAFNSFKHEIAKGAAHSHTGKAIPAALIEKYEADEEVKAKEVSAAQLKNIYAQEQLTRIEDSLAKREQLGDGLAVIDFEQLKIENTTLMEKIDDRNEELTKLRKKTTSAVQVLTHVREKLHFVSAEVVRLASELQEVETRVSSQRTELATGKKMRDTTRQDTERAKHSQGFAYNDRLAIDFEVRKRTILRLKDDLKHLQDTYAELHGAGRH